ncbi:MAG TPA: class I SAM-dependent methyltransferase [Woeseiaceae bacterium]|nr:class I SAM-dependent methyltransferase [Woeseiaceae bacterium]
MALVQPAHSGSSAEEITAAVRRFYERHPYPPPIASLDRERWNDPLRQRASYHLLWPADSFRDDRSVLVAGCGTSQAAKYAIRWPHARVTGIDVSRGSIERTAELGQKYGLANLELAELPVERAAGLGRRFDHIVCTGVLHHLPDPDAALQALHDALEPHGALHLMVYAPYGRAGIYLLREYCRRLGVGASSRDIADLAVTLRSLPDQHPLSPLLRRASDFTTEAGIADALLNPQDRPYSVPELFDLLDRNALQFGRWLRQAPYLPQCGAAAGIPHRRVLARLPARERYAAMELFRGTMLRHSAIVYRADHPGGPQNVQFDDDRWLGYVPVRMPDTVCVEHRLPAGAAGVLINRGHTDTDLYLPIDAQQKRWLAAIDGSRPINEWVKRGDTEAARVFFKRLMQHDQVVMDTSGSPGANAPGG